MIIKNIAFVFLIICFYRVSPEVLTEEHLIVKNNVSEVLPLESKGDSNKSNGSLTVDINQNDTYANSNKLNISVVFNTRDLATAQIDENVTSIEDAILNNNASDLDTAQNNENYNLIEGGTLNNLTEVFNKTAKKGTQGANLRTELEISIDISITATDVNITELVEKQKKYLLSLVETEAIKTAEGKLILTPYIEKGHIGEARNASAVNPQLFLGIKSYSGFLTVNKSCNSNTFFWYFPVENKPVNETPWILWLQGGPGASSMAGLFGEIGPFKIGFKKNLIRNPYTWLRNHSLVFIDNPIGTGFSFTECSDGYVTNMSTYSKHLYEATKQLLQLFPELRPAPLYVAGESYAGKFVPALAWQIHKHKNDSGGDVNLQGIMLGNAFSDPSVLSNFLKPFYYFGLLQSEQLETLKPLYTAFLQAVAERDSVRTKLIWMLLIPAVMKLDHLPDVYNFLHDDFFVSDFVPFLNRPEIQDALHVGRDEFEIMSIKANVALTPDFLSSSTSLIEKLLEHYRVLVYCGQLDQMMACAHLTENYRTLKWSRVKQFHEAKRQPMYEWRMLQYRLVGYYKTGGGLTEAIIRGAGHIVPADRPQASQELVTRWIYRQPIIGNVALKTNSDSNTVQVKRLLTML